MVRTIISLDDEEKAWLDSRARQKGVPMTAVVREALAAYRVTQGRPQQDLKQALEQTRGLWHKGDGLAWQEQLREEWDER